MSSTESFYTALLALSGDPALVEARRGLLASIKDQDLCEVIAHGLASGICRASIESIATWVLDRAVARASRVGSVDVPVINNAPARLQAEKVLRNARQGPNSNLPASEREKIAEATDEEFTPLSSRTGKRRRQETSKTPRKQRRPSRTAASRFKKQQAKSKRSSEDATMNRVSEDGDNTDDRLTHVNQFLWWEVQEQSIMIDLNLTAEDNEDDEDYTEDMATKSFPGRFRGWVLVLLIFRAWKSPF